MGIFTSRMYNNKLEQKICELKDEIEKKKGILASLKNSQGPLERELEESFIELEGKRG